MLQNDIKLPTSHLLESLFDAYQLVEYDIYSRTPTPEGRADFIATNLVAFFRADLHIFLLLSR